MNRKGFTLIELMIVVVIIGILAAIAIPNFMSMQDRAKESTVKANMHTIQLTAEDYSTRKDGIYPVDNTSTAPGASGSDILFGAMLPANIRNPFTGALGSDAVAPWNGAAAAPGFTGYEGAITGYTITGYGKNSILTLTLTPGVSN